jgi:hypothetical protein
MLPSGRQTRFDNSIAWAVVYPRKAGFLESSIRGKFKITERGAEILKSNNHCEIWQMATSYPICLICNPNLRHLPRVPDEIRYQHQLYAGRLGYRQWEQQLQAAQDADVPILKTHAIHGATACVNHFMGVIYDRLRGGAGGGHNNSRNKTDHVGIIAASIDPVAPYYWAAKNILMPATRQKGYSDLESMNPDNKSPGSFGDWLRLSSAEIVEAGHPGAIDEMNLSVYLG